MTGDQFGSAFAVGDIDGDGYTDIIVGSPGYNAGKWQGRVYVYPGSASGLVHLSPRFSLTGDNTGYATYFGSAIACADVNGDGYADVIVGEYGYNVGEYSPNHSAGRVKVYLGSATGLNITPALTLTGGASYQFGYSVAAVGDVNGDGYGDFVVGAPGYNDRSGRAYLYLGGSSLSSTPAGDFRGLEPGAFGQWAASAGDVNGDGYADVMIGAPEYNANQGRALVYLGTSAGLSTAPVLTLTGETEGSKFGQSGGLAGDVNGDGYADVVIGAGGYLSSTGRAYVYLGNSAGIASTPAVTLTGEAAGNDFGGAIGTAGDVNGDGYADVVIGADGYSSSLGRAYLYLGSQAGLGATAALTLTGQTASGRFGASVGGAGDVNGDGYADLAAGAPGVAGNRSSQGAVNAYHGGAFPPSATPQRVLTGDPNDQLGTAAATAGDVNGDGFADLIVGAEGYAANQGRAYLYLGSDAGLTDTPAVTLTGESAGDQFGAAVAAAGDVNGDGYADVIVGEPGYDSGRGRASFYLGDGEGLQLTPALSLTGQSPGDYFGASVGTAGDVNGDGYADFVIGAPGASHAYVYYGGRNLSVAPGLTLTGENGADMFGRSVGAAGDVNGDGYADLIVGAAGYGGQQGRAYVYLGHNTGLEAAPALTLTGGSPGNRFGNAVGTAGDVSGDGCADFVVGAPGASRAYVYLGGASLTAVPALTLAGSPGDDFGVSVGTAGDVNGDGFGDIIVGADAASGSQGRAYVYLGGPTGVAAAAAFTLAGESAGSHLGSAAGTAGDLNGDGFADLVAAASGFGNSQGRVYVHLGNGGGGKDALAQAERADDGLPVQPWGLTRTPYGFQVSLAAADPLGRGRVKAQAQICLPGKPFSDPSCVMETSPTWVDVAASPTVTLTVTDLTPSTLYRWRARILHAPFSVTSAGAPPNPAHGPWRRFLAQSQEADVKTARLYFAYLPFVVH